MGTLQVASSDDADNPLQRGSVPLLALDVWGHGYCVDYRSERARCVGPNQADGDAVSDERYRVAATEFAASGRVEAAAREAARGEED